MAEQQVVLAGCALPAVPWPSHTLGSELPMVVLDKYQAVDSQAGFQPCVWPLIMVEPCPVALGPLDSRHKHHIPDRLLVQDQGL